MFRYAALFACICFVTAAPLPAAGADAPAPARVGQASSLVPAGGQRPDARQLHDGIREILARPEYQQPDLTWLQKLTTAVTDWLRRLFGGWGVSFAKLHAVWPLLYWIIVALLVAALAAVLYHIFWTLATAFGTRTRRASKGSVVHEDLAPEKLRSQAAALAAQGRFGEALVALHAALIRLLDLRGVLRYDRARTNWEYLDSVRRDSEAAGVLEPLTRHLDPVLYGGEALAEAQYRACEALVTGIWAGGGAAA